MARRHGITVKTVHSWHRKAKQRGTVEALPRETTVRIKELEKRLEKTATENAVLKRIVGDKELELVIFREMRDTLEQCTGYKV